MACLRLQPVFIDLNKLSNSTSDEIKAMWTIITKAKDSIEYGHRLENLSWRLWYSSTIKGKSLTPSTSKSMLNIQDTIMSPKQVNDDRKVIKRKIPNRRDSLERIIHSFSHLLTEIQRAAEAKRNQELDAIILGVSTSESALAKKSRNAYVDLHHLAHTAPLQFIQEDYEKEMNERCSSLNENPITKGFIPVKIKKSYSHNKQDQNSSTSSQSRKATSKKSGSFNVHQYFIKKEKYRDRNKQNTLDSSDVKFMVSSVSSNSDSEYSCCDFDSNNEILNLDTEKSQPLSFDGCMPDCDNACCKQSLLSSILKNIDIVVDSPCSSELVKKVNSFDLKRNSSSISELVFPLQQMDSTFEIW
ncbi:hypothetical protein O9G_000809 [Rozella allomycis CSF55]|uniref:Nitrogen regulatory protein areA GATA-like domain-containing protein n=1 Tax=Rozella allomycis (strain CSF55) TaxID=988480 RepID=A0A075AW32_ROZAC|nr:hypothetical protein O9G_000809 [Rozella allomycis CSF55]|eukprot:EPZ32734.1 hypothetical protein O9G_000809 [Rozella allomycis CSF55]